MSRVLRAEPAGLAEILRGLAAGCQRCGRGSARAVAAAKHAAEYRANVHTGVIGDRRVQRIGFRHQSGVLRQPTDDQWYGLLDRGLCLRGDRPEPRSYRPAMLEGSRWLRT